MNPTLTAVAGPLAGESFVLGEVPGVIGRDPASWIAVSDLALSRRHATLRRDGERIVVQDLESRNGTLVNGVPVREHALAHGDRIQVGDSLFVFQHAVPDTPTPAVVEEGELAAATTLRLGVAGDAGPTPPRALGALLALARELPSFEDEARLLGAIVNGALDAIAAERAAVLVLGSGGDLRAPAARSRSGETPVAIGRSAALRAIRERASLLANDVTAADGDSVLSRRVAAVIAAPLVLRGTPLGALVLERADPGARFAADDLETATALASFAALALDAVRRVHGLEEENRWLLAETGFTHDLVGESRALAEVLAKIAKVAPSDATVLVTGESGTGKELAARALHRNSPRGRRPFVALNCAAVTESLLESELFGHEKGAFTGAVASKKGRFELAEGGTLFLDEVGELSPALQAKLLRVLQEREVERVGGARPIPIDVRVIAATNRDLAAAVKSGAFREDLYYRLAVVTLRMPPLRERKEDVPLLAAWFVTRFAARAPRRVRGLSPSALARLRAHDFPGNVRELANAIERAVILGAGELIEADDLPETMSAARAEPEESRFAEAVLETKRRLVNEALAKAGSVTGAARLLGLHPNYLHRLLRSLGLREG